MTFMKPKFARAAAAMSLGRRLPGPQLPGRSVLVIETGAGAAPRLAQALVATYPHWTVVALDPASAQSFLGDGHTDVVVPVGTNGDGPALTEWLRKEYPSAAIATFHLAAMEPGIDATSLGHRLGRTLVLRERLSDFELVAFAAEMKRIPVVSSVYQDICRLVGGPGDADYSLAEVADLVSQDPGIAVRVLKIVNSAAFGLRRSVENVPQAVALLGAKRIAALMLWVDLRDQLTTGSAAAHLVERDWETARLVASLSRELALIEGLDRDSTETAYLAGLLHNIGRLMLAANVPDHFASVAWSDDLVARTEQEKRFLSVRHTELGSLLLRFWGMDDTLAEAAGFYLDPSAGATRTFGPLAAVHAAVVLAGRGGLAWDDDYLAAAGLEDRIDAWSNNASVVQLMSL